MFFILIVALNFVYHGLHVQFK